MSNEFTPLDFAATWQAYTNWRQRSVRTDEDDRAMWASFAEKYDARVPVSEGLLALIRALARPGDTVLDVGAGTGRMALPVARFVRRVTALDYSSAMLAVLQRKMVEQEISNIEIVETSWEEAQVSPHDIVMAVFSLYRQPDILGALRKLVNVTRRTLIIVEADTGLKPPHEIPHGQLLAELWGGAEGIPNYLYFAGMLWQLGMRADVRVLYEHRSFQGATPGEIAWQLAPAYAKPEEVELFAQRLEPLLSHSEHGYCYCYTVPMGIVIWTRN